MTILPKKKQNKNTSNEDDRDKDHSNERYNYGHLSSTSSSSSGQISPNNRSWSSRSEDKRSAPDADCSTDHSNIGASLSKRRHRSNRERDVNPDIQRSLISSVRTLNKSSSISSSSNTSRDLINSENDLAIPGSSGLINRDDNDIKHSGMLVSVGMSLRQRCSDDEDKEDISGYNSGDEYQKPNEHVTNIDWEEKERIFDWKIRKKGFTIKKMCEDGACLFRAVADQVYGDQDMHSAVRKLCMDYMEKNCDYFSHYVTENFEDYIQRKRSDHIHGNHIEMQALCEIFNRPIEVYHYSTEPINIFQGCQQKNNDNEPIRLSYHRNVHYDSIVNPYKATIGVGLGLPSFKPGIAEKSLMEKAIRISEQHVLEQAMLEDKIRATDWEATNEAIEEQIARESYLEWLREKELRLPKKASPTSTLTKFVEEESNNSTNNLSVTKEMLPRPSSNSPPRGHISPRSFNNEMVENTKSITSSQNKLNIEETSKFRHHVPPSVLGLNDWTDNDDIIAQVLAQSQVEYIESLKKSNSTSNQNLHSALNASQSSDAATTSEYFASLPSTSSNYKV